MKLREALAHGQGAVRGHRHDDEGQLIVWPTGNTERRVFSWPRNPGPRSEAGPLAADLLEDGREDWQPLTPERLS